MKDDNEIDDLLNGDIQQSTPVKWSVRFIGTDNQVHEHSGEHNLGPGERYISMHVDRYYKAGQWCDVSFGDFEILNIESDDMFVNFEIERAQGGNPGGANRS